jgi:hypothetical protein
MVNKTGEKTEAYPVLNPCGEAKVAVPVPLAPRVGNLEGKVVYCISQFVGGADTFMQKVAGALPQQVPGLRTVYRRKPAAYMTDDPELWSEIREKAHAVIYGCGA